MVSHVLHVHLAFPHTQAAAVAAIRIHFDARDREPVKESVDRTERADKAAEAAVAESA